MHHWALRGQRGNSAGMCVYPKPRHPLGVPPMPGLGSSSRCHAPLGPARAEVESLPPKWWVEWGGSQKLSCCVCLSVCVCVCGTECPSTQRQRSRPHHSQTSSQTSGGALSFCVFSAPVGQPKRDDTGMAGACTLWLDGLSNQCVGGWVAVSE